MKKAVKRAAPARRCQRLPPLLLPFAGSAMTGCCWANPGGDRPGVPAQPRAGLMASAETAAGTACARRSPPARSCPAPPCWWLSQYVEASHAADLPADPSGAVGYLLKNRVAKVEEVPDAWTGSPAARRCSTPRSLPNCWPGSAGTAPWRH
jgi:hypothetical protein